MMPYKPPICAVLLTLTLFLIVPPAFFPSPADAVDTGPRHVLLIHSYHKGMKWVDDITRSFTDTLRRAYPAIEFHVEYMDTKRVVGEEHLRNLYREYRHKFSRQKFDLVAAADDNAYRFAVKHQPDLFPATPIVFCGVNDFDPALIAGNPLVTGVIEKLSVRETVETALALQPNLKRLYIINDRTETGRGLHREIAAELATFSERLAITWLEEYTSAHHFTLGSLSIPDLLHETASFFEKTSQAHTLIVDCPPDLPPLRGDAEQLLRAITNLVSNAFKYSPDGGEITIRAALDNGEIVICVTDQGIGIPPAARELIFERFYRVDNSDRRRIGGTGLGLALVREIVRAHGGRVWVDSACGKGSTFSVALPLNCASGAGAASS